MTGRRVAFGREDAPPAELADAVAASCAVPGFYRPVEIGRRPYVDGGVCSLSNLDVVATEGLDLVLCLNPGSSRAPGGGARATLRAAAGRRLGREARKVRAAGAEVVLVQHTADDLAIMGPKRVRAERLYNALFPDLPDEQANRLLITTISALRHRLRKAAGLSRTHDPDPILHALRVSACSPNS